MEPEYPELQVAYHCLLLYQAGMLDAEPVRSDGHRVVKVYPLGLTWQGHEFLAKIRNDTTWQKAKAVALQKGGSLSFAVLNHVSTKYAKDVLEWLK